GDRDFFGYAQCRSDRSGQADAAGCLVYRCACSRRRGADTLALPPAAKQFPGSQDPGRTLGCARRNRQAAGAGDDLWSLGFGENLARDLPTDRSLALPEVQITRGTVEARAIARARCRGL